MAKKTFKGPSMESDFILHMEDAKKKLKEFQNDAQSPIEINIKDPTLKNLQASIKRSTEEAEKLVGKLEEMLNAGDSKNAKTFDSFLNSKLKQLERDKASYAQLESKIMAQVEAMDGNISESTSSAVPVLSKEMQAEMDKLEEQAKRYQDILNRINEVSKMKSLYEEGEPIKLGFKATEEAAQQLIDKYNELDGVVKQSNTNSIEFADALSEQAKIVLQLCELQSKLIDKKGSSPEFLNKFLELDQYNESVVTTVLADFDDYLDEITKTAKDGLSVANQEINKFNESIKNVSKQEAPKSVTDEVKQIGESASGAKKNVDSLTQSLENLRIAGASMQVDISKGKIKGKESMSLIGVNGIISTVSGQDYSVGTDVLVDQLASNLGKNVIMSLHNHPDGMFFTPSDLKTFAELYHDQGVKLHGIISDGLIQTVDFSGLSKDIVQKIAQSYNTWLADISAGISEFTYADNKLELSDDTKNLLNTNPDEYNKKLKAINNAMIMALNNAFEDNNIKSTFGAFGNNEIELLSNRVRELGQNFEGVIDPVQKLKNLLTTLNPNTTFDWDSFGDVFAKLQSGDMTGVQAIEQIVNATKQIEQSSATTQIEKQTDATKQLADATKQAADAQKELNQASQSKASTPENTADVQKINQRIGELQKIINNQNDWVKYLGDALGEAQFKTSGKKEATEQLRNWTKKLQAARQNDYADLSWREYAKEILELSWSRAYQEAERQNVASSTLSRYHTDAGSNYENNLKTLQDAYLWHQKTLESSQAELSVLQQKLSLTKEIKDASEQTETNKPTIQSGTFDGITESANRASESVDNLKNKIQEVNNTPAQIGSSDTSAIVSAQGSLQQLGTAAANALNNSVQDTNIDDVINQAGNAADVNKQKLESFGDAAQKALGPGSIPDVDNLGGAQTAGAVNDAADAIKTEGEAAAQASQQKNAFYEANQKVASGALQTAQGASAAAEGIKQEGQAAVNAKKYLKDYQQAMILAAKINNNPLVDKEKLAQGVASFKSGFKQMWADNENTGWNNIENVANLEILIDKFKEYCSQLDQTAQKEQQVKQAQNAFFKDKTPFTVNTSLDDIAKQAEEAANKISDAQKKMQDEATQWAKNRFGDGAEVYFQKFTEGANGIKNLDFSVFDSATGTINTFTVAYGEAANKMSIDTTTMTNALKNFKSAQTQAGNLKSILSTFELSDVSISGNISSSILQAQQTLAKLNNEIAKGSGQADSSKLAKLSADAKILTTELNKAYKQYMQFENFRANGIDLGKIDFGGDISKQLKDSLEAWGNENDFTNIRLTDLNETTGKFKVTAEGANNTVHTFTGSLNQLSNAVAMQETNVQQLGSKWDRFKASLSKTGKQLMVALVGYNAFFKVISEIRKGIGYVKEIDLAMTELKKVTDESEASYNRFLETASKSASIVGSTISDFTEATANFARLGYTMEESADMAKTAIVYKNVADGLDTVEESTESIISTMKAFGIESSDTMGIIDRFNEVGNNFAISSAGIGEAMQRSASALYEAGNTIDESIGLITAANSVIQNPEQVGECLPT